MNFKFVALAALAAMSIGSAHATHGAHPTDWGVLNTEDGASSFFHAAAGTLYDHFYTFELDGNYFLSETAVVNNNKNSVFESNFASLERLVEGEWQFIDDFRFTNQSTTHSFGLQGPGKYRTEVVAYSSGSNTAYGSIQTQIEYASNPDVTPVPEPETYALLLAGLGAMGFVARRRSSV